VTDTISADVLLFAALPYVCIALLLAGSAERLLKHPESLTSRSSQVLENRRHFWAMVPFHYGLLAVLAGHLLAFAAPAVVLGWNASPIRLYALEATGLACGLLAVLGLGSALARRATVPAVRRTTAVGDWMVLVVLLAQLASGVGVAVAYSWGSSWFAAVAAPYLWSLLRLRPDVAAISAMPVAVKAHVVGAFLLLGVFPFSRLVHVFNVPLPYLWRRPQIVRWYGHRPAALGKRS
jgi:nitrate reductase gamma subunit